MLRKNDIYFEYQLNYCYKNVVGGGEEGMEKWSLPLLNKIIDLALSLLILKTQDLNLWTYTFLFIELLPSFILRPFWNFLLIPIRKTLSLASFKYQFFLHLLNINIPKYVNMVILFFLLTYVLFCNGAKKATYLYNYNLSF